MTSPYTLAARLATGEADPSAAFMQGRTKVAGDQAALLRLLPLMATPEYRTATALVAGRTRADGRARRSCAGQPPARWRSRSSR